MAQPPIITEISPSLYQRRVTDYLRRMHPHISALPQLAVNDTTSADMSSGHTTAASPLTLFNVTGDVMVSVFGVVQGTAITSTGSTGTLEIGTTEDTNGLLGTTTANGTQFAATDVWVDTSPANDVEALPAARWFIIGGGADIILTIAANNMTAGSMNYYCFWIPLSDNALVESA